jgi:hypothetical protein
LTGSYSTGYSATKNGLHAAVHVDPGKDFFAALLADGVIAIAGDIAGLMGAVGSVQIPVTLIYRIVEGAYPGDQLAAASGPGAVQFVWQRVEGPAATVNTVLYGLFSIISGAVALSAGALTVLAVLYSVVTPAVWVVVASILDLVRC